MKICNEKLTKRVVFLFLNKKSYFAKVCYCQNSDIWEKFGKNYGIKYAIYIKIGLCWGHVSNVADSNNFWEFSTNFTYFLSPTFLLFVLICKWSNLANIWVGATAISASFSFLTFLPEWLVIKSKFSR